jgi:hypothetical protein
MAEEDDKRRGTGVSIMKQNASLKPESVTAMLLLALPALVIILSILVWVAAVSHSGFWADDFFNITHYNRSLGDLSYHDNQGKYIINAFWALGTLAFGLGSVVPFLLLNTLVFVVGIVTWLRIGTTARWGITEAWWISGLFLATATWLPTALWSSNIVHSVGFLALGLGLLAHERSMKARTVRDSMLWSLAGGAAWTLAVISNLLYLGLLVIAAYCAFHQIRKIRELGFNGIRAGVSVGAWSLLLPVVYFLAIAYPATTASAPYAKNGFQFVGQNLHYYRELLAPTSILLVLYAVISVLGIIGGIAAIRRRDWFPIAVLGAAGATAIPALVQGQQRDIHYAAMPLLLTFSALAAGARPVLISRSKRLIRMRNGFVLIIAFALIFIFRQGTGVRSFFIQTPYGGRLTTFRSEVASLTPEGAAICANLELSTQNQALLTAEMSGENGFLIPPINAAQVFLLPEGQPCPAPTSATHITIKMNPQGAFIASA